MTERALAARGGVLSDGFALFPILEGVIRIKTRGDTDSFFPFGVGLSYSNPYGENYSAHKNLVVHEKPGLK